MTMTEDLRDEATPNDDPLDLAERLKNLITRYPDDARTVRLALAPILHTQPSRRPPPVAVPVNEIRGDFPKATLAASGLGGVLLAAGQICLLSAEGGVGKSALTGAMALATAMLPDTGIRDDPMPLEGGFFTGAGGQVLMATYEDPPPVTKWRLVSLAENIDAKSNTDRATEALSRIHILDMSGWTIYGPADQSGYSGRSVQLAGWDLFWDAVATIKPKLIVIDPFLKAYSGESNSIQPVRDALGTFSLAMEEHCETAGMVMVAHSTKNARGGKQDPFDPGQVAGSGALADENRGVMTMTWNEDTDRRVLAIPKANWGPSKILIDLDPVLHPSGAVIGFRAANEWRRRNATTSKTEKGKESDPQESNLQKKMTMGGEYAGIGE